VAGVFRRYNNQSNQVVSSETRSVICDETTEIDGEHYMDFSSGRVVKVDQLEQAIIDDNVEDVEPIEVPGDLAEMREAVEAQLVEYVNGQYAKGTAIVNVAVQGEGLVVLISGEKLSLKNFWVGRWTTKFVINFNSKCMDGSIKIRVHYFENGNVQMTTDKNVEDVFLDFESAESLGEAVRAAVAEQESEVQDSLEEMYVNMSKETFKDMRRVLPITRQKMDWSGAQLQLAKGFASR